MNRRRRRMELISDSWHAASGADCLAGRRHVGLFEHRLGNPYLIGILVYGAVAGEFSHAGHVEDGAVGPLLLVAVQRLHTLLCGDVGLIVDRKSVAIPKV